MPDWYKDYVEEIQAVDDCFHPQNRRSDPNNRSFLYNLKVDVEK
jgi:hypothetical protein